MFRKLSVEENILAVLEGREVNHDAASARRTEDGEAD